MIHGVSQVCKEGRLAQFAHLVVELHHVRARDGLGRADLVDRAYPVAWVCLALWVVELHAPEVARAVTELLDGFDGGLCVVAHDYS